MKKTIILCLVVAALGPLFLSKDESLMSKIKPNVLMIKTIDSIPNFDIERLTLVQRVELEQKGSLILNKSITKFGEYPTFFSYLPVIRLETITKIGDGYCYKSKYQVGTEGYAYWRILVILLLVLVIIPFLGGGDDSLPIVFIAGWIAYFLIVWQAWVNLPVCTEFLLIIAIPLVIMIWVSSLRILLFQFGGR